MSFLSSWILSFTNSWQNLKEQEERRERVTGHRALTPFKFQPAFDNFDEEKLVSSNGSDIVIKMSPMLQTYDNESLVLQRVDQVRVSSISKE